MIWSELDSVFAQNSSFLISSHLSLDGDSVGSQLAVYWYLTSLGKRVLVYNHDPLPHKFAFLHDSAVLSTQRPQGRFDVLVVLDCSNPSRLGWNGQRDVCSRIVNIDHHRDNVLFGDLNFVRADGTATGQIIYDFFGSRKVDYPRHVAESLYTAIVTDTGGFRFSNTNGEILRMCADLSDRGADCAKIFEKVYTSVSQSGMRLQASIWSTLAFHLDGAVCCMEMPYRLIDECGATYGDSEGMADLTILADGVKVGMLIKYDDRQTHFSLRSKGTVDVGRIAQGVRGGGGHESAAGCTMDLPHEEAKAAMLAIIAKEL
jgi:phosphoesterase RecJ-like protein